MQDNDIRIDMSPNPKLEPDTSYKIQYQIEVWLHNPRWFIPVYHEIFDQYIKAPHQFYPDVSAEITIRWQYLKFCTIWQSIFAKIMIIAHVTFWTITKIIPTGIFTCQLKTVEAECLAHIFTRNFNYILATELPDKPVLYMENAILFQLTNFKNFSCVVILDIF